MNNSLNVRRAQQLMLDARVTLADLATAERVLDEYLAGYPEQVSGASPAEPAPITDCDVVEDDVPCAHARPCPVHDVKLTGPERLASQGDRARRDAEQLREDLRVAAHVLQRAARIVHRWASRGVDRESVERALVEFDEGIWCRHCSRFGRHEPRHVIETSAEGVDRLREHCQFCHDFKVQHKRLPPREIWAARDARGRLDQTTVERILRDVRAREQAAKSEPAAIDPASTRAERHRSRIEALRDA